MQFAGALQTFDGGVQFRVVAEYGSQGVVVERIIRTLLDRAPHGLDCTTQVPAQMLDTGEQTQHFGVVWKQRDHANDMALSLIHAGQFQGVGGGDHVADRLRR